MSNTVASIEAQIAALMAQRDDMLLAEKRESEERASKLTKSKDVTVDVVSKTRNQRGQTYGGQSCGLQATIGKRDGVGFIRLHGLYKSYNGDTGKQVDRTFKVGDMVEYDSFNLKYLGIITNITEKRVTVEPRYGSRTKSMDLYSFTWRNYDLDLDKVHAENAETSMYI